MLHEYPYSIKQHGTTLDQCEDEPVQTPGCIQAHGVLLVLRRSDLTILQISENSRAWLGCAPQDLLATHVSVAVGEAVARDIRTALDHERLELTPPLSDDPRTEGSSQHSIAARQPAHLFESGPPGLADAIASDIELPDQIGVDPDYYKLVRATLTRFQALRVSAT